MSTSNRQSRRQRGEEPEKNQEKEEKFRGKFFEESHREQAFQINHKDIVDKFQNHYDNGNDPTVDELKAYAESANLSDITIEKAYTSYATNRFREELMASADSFVENSADNKPLFDIETELSPLAVLLCEKMLKFRNGHMKNEEVYFVIKRTGAKIDQIDNWFKMARHEAQITPLNGGPKKMDLGLPVIFQNRKTSGLIRAVEEASGTVRPGRNRGRNPRTRSTDDSEDSKDSGAAGPSSSSRAERRSPPRTNDDVFERDPDSHGPGTSEEPIRVVGKAAETSGSDRAAVRNRERLQQIVHHDQLDSFEDRREAGPSSSSGVKRRPPPSSMDRHDVVFERDLDGPRTSGTSRPVRNGAKKARTDPMEDCEDSGAAGPSSSSGVKRRRSPSNGNRNPRPAKSSRTSRPIRNTDQDDRNLEFEAPTALEMPIQAGPSNSRPIEDQLNEMFNGPAIQSLAQAVVRIFGTLDEVIMDKTIQMFNTNFRNLLRHYDNEGTARRNAFRGNAPKNQASDDVLNQNLNNNQEERAPEDVNGQNPPEAEAQVEDDVVAPEETPEARNVHEDVGDEVLEAEAREQLAEGAVVPENAPEDVNGQNPRVPEEEDAPEVEAQVEDDVVAPEKAPEARNIHEDVGDEVLKAEAREQLPEGAVVPENVPEEGNVAEDPEAAEVPNQEVAPRDKLKRTLDDLVKKACEKLKDYYYEPGDVSDLFENILKAMGQMTSEEKEEEEAAVRKFTGFWISTIRRESLDEPPEMIQIPEAVSRRVEKNLRKIVLGTPVYKEIIKWLRRLLNVFKEKAKHLDPSEVPHLVGLQYGFDWARIRELGEVEDDGEAGGADGDDSGGDDDEAPGDNSENPEDQASDTEDSENPRKDEEGRGTSGGPENHQEDVPEPANGHPEDSDEVSPVQPEVEASGGEAPNDVAPESGNEAENSKAPEVPNQDVAPEDVPEARESSDAPEAQKVPEDVTISSDVDFEANEPENQQEAPEDVPKAPEDVPEAQDQPEAPEAHEDQNLNVRSSPEAHNPITLQQIIESACQNFKNNWTPAKNRNLHSFFESIRDATKDMKSDDEKAAVRKYTGFWITTIWPSDEPPKKEQTTADAYGRVEKALRKPVYDTSVYKDLDECINESLEMYRGHPEYERVPYHIGVHFGFDAWKIKELSDLED